MKVFKNNLDSSGNLFQISALPILNSLVVIMNEYDECSTYDYRDNYFIEVRTRLRHARRELFNIFNSLTGMG